MQEEEVTICSKVTSTVVNRKQLLLATKCIKIKHHGEYLKLYMYMKFFKLYLTLCRASLTISVKKPAASCLSNKSSSAAAKKPRHKVIH